MSTKRTPWIILVIALSLLFSGAAGLAGFEQIPYGEALWQAALLLLTHFSHVEIHDPRARALSLFLIISSLAMLGYLLKWFAEYMIGVGDNVRKRRLQTKINKLENHYIVCGLGRVGSQVAREMAIEGVPFVALDRDKAKVEEAAAEGCLAFVDDSSSEEALKRAGISKAAGLVASLGDDPANLLVVLTARALRPDLYIVARANRHENEIKLKRAGADRVALPYQIGGYHMASMALRPSVVDYMDIVSNSDANKDLQVEEMVVGEHSRLAGHRLGKALAEGSVGATVIAINGSDGTSRVRPTGHEMIYAGDRLIVLGAKSDLTKASDLVR